MLLLALRRGGAQSWNSLYTRRWAYESIDFEKEGETDGGLGRAVDRGRYREGGAKPYWRELKGRGRCMSRDSKPSGVPGWDGWIG